MKIRDIVIIGSGNVASHLGMALAAKGYLIQQVYSPTMDHAKSLAEDLKADYCSEPELILPGADLYLLAISDSAISRFLEGFNAGSSVLVHTSGGLPMNILQSSAINFGVLYPLMTFSKNFPVDLSVTPVCTEASGPEVSQALFEMAFSISRHVFQISSFDRAYLHLAAVFANNFSNHMFAIAQELTQARGYDFNLLMPLIEKTVEKLRLLTPDKAQTGPARRGDHEIIEKHLQMLEEPNRTIYAVLSRAILSACQPYDCPDNPGNFKS